MRLLFVHGIAQGGKDEQTLRRVWIESLQEGFDNAGLTWRRDVTIDLPHYGDVLDQFVADEDLPATDALQGKGSGVADDYDRFLREALVDLQEAKVSEAEVLAEIDPTLPKAKSPQNWPWVRAVAKVIDRRLTPLSGFTIDRALREVFVYTRRAYAAREINQLIDAALTPEPTVVVSHSLGTVVAYHVLRAAQGRDVRGLVTLGSPLGLRALADTLGVLEHPVPKAGWFNAYDPRDIVALRPLERPWFEVDPGIDNHGGVDNNTENRHGIIGYLNDAKVAARIAKAME